MLGIADADAQTEPTLAAGIAAQPVANALADFAKQTGLQLIYVSQLAKDRVSAGAPPPIMRGDLLPPATLRLAANYQVDVSGAIGAPRRRARDDRLAAAADCVRQ